MNKKIIIGIITSLLLSGVIGCSKDTQSSDKKMENQKTQKMNMTDKEMKNMKKSDKK